MDDSDYDTTQAKALDTLRKLIKKPRDLCVCLTNTDRMNVPIKTTKNLYSLGEVAKVIEADNLPFFPMTNVGYQPINYQDRLPHPNYDHSTGGVRFGGTDWGPVGVARPLFQLFSSLEMRDRSLTQLRYPE